MESKKYTVTCEGKEVEVTEEVYRLYVTEPKSERRLIRKRKISRIVVNAEKEMVYFIPSREDSLDRLVEEGMEFEDASFSVDTLDVALSVHQALKKLNPKERYIIESLFINGDTEESVAVKLNTTQANINKRKHRILLKLKKFLINL